MVRRVAFAVPGDLATPTGGYAYDRRMIAELERLGWQVDVVGLGDGFPRPTAAQKDFAARQLAAVSSDHPVLIDGLALGVLPEAAAIVRHRRALVALIHHPLALETGLSIEDADAMRSSERERARRRQHRGRHQPANRANSGQGLWRGQGPHHGGASGHGSRHHRTQPQW